MAVLGTTSPATAPAVRPKIVISRARRIRSLLWWTVSGLSLALPTLPVVWILIGVIAKGVSVWNRVSSFTRRRESVATTWQM